jgi:hypothetical protein
VGLGRFVEHLTCPVEGCGFEYNHPAAVVVNRGGVLDIIEGERMRLPRRAFTRRTGRGSSVWIEFVGECRHRWALHLQFHEGMMFYDCEIRPDEDAEDDILIETTTFWRD